MGRSISIITGTVVLLGAATYAPLTLLAPVPPLEHSTALPAATSPVAAIPELTTTGQAALASADGTQILAQGGEMSAVPIADITRLLTALIVIEARPLSGDDAGPVLPVTSADFDREQKLAEQGHHTVPVFPGDGWSERDALEALLLGHSVNHAELIATWALGSPERFLSAAQTWLTSHGLRDTVIADPAGLSEANVSTASDLARAAALLGAHPVLHSILTGSPGTLARSRGVTPTPAPVSGDGLSVLHVGYTERAGFGLLSLDSVTTEAGTLVVAGASLRSDTWESLRSEVAAAQKLTRQAVTAGPVISPGTAILTLTSAWGDTAEAITGESPAEAVWRSAEPTIEVTLKPNLRLVEAGDALGTISVDSGPGSPGGTAPQRTIGLSANDSIRPPSILWRLTHPAELLGPWLSDLVGFKQR